MRFLLKIKEEHGKMKGRTLLGLTIVISMMLAMLPHVAVKASPATMEIVFENGLHEIVKMPCENFVVTLKVVNAPDITQWIAEITWDPAVLELKTGTQADVTEGPFLKSVGSTVFAVKPPEPGRIPEMTCGLYTGSASGTGDLAYIDFHAKAPGDSPITLVQYYLLNGVNILPCDSVDGLVHVLPPPAMPPNAVFTPWSGFMVYVCSDVILDGTISTLGLDTLPYTHVCPITEYKWDIDIGNDESIDFTLYGEITGFHCDGPGWVGITLTVWAPDPIEPSAPDYVDHNSEKHVIIQILPPSQYTYEKEGLEQLDQHARKDWGDNWCGPTAAGTSLAWFAEKKNYPKLVPDPGNDGIDEEDKYEAINKLGELMKTDPNKGTRDSDFIKGLENYINGVEYGGKFKVTQFPNPTYQQYIDELTAGEDVLLGIPGHWVVGSAVNENPPPQDVQILDPWDGTFKDTTWNDLKCDLMVSISPVDSPTSYDPRLYGYAVVVNGITYVINGTYYDEVYIVDGQVFGVPDGTVYNTTGTVYGFANGTVIIENGAYFPVTGSAYIINGTNSRVMPPIPDHDISISKIKPTNTVVGCGYSVLINVTVYNMGNQNETFTAAVYADTTPAGAKGVTLTRGNHTTLTFTWNTTGFVKGNYTISAVADQVLGETDLDDNHLTDGWVLITKVGDIGGQINDFPTFFACDGKVDGIDLALFIACYKGPPECPPNARYLADLGGQINDFPTFYACDDKVDGIDLALWIACYKGLGPDP